MTPSERDWRNFGPASDRWVRGVVLTWLIVGPIAAIVTYVGFSR